MNTRTKIAAAAAVILFMTAGIISAQNTTLNQRKPVIADRDLVIQIADITENALFYPVDIDGMRMEVLAVKALDGTIRTAFNACQVCYSSGRGYFVQNGTVLVCQNCGRRYRMSQVERQAGGCNPEPIFPANKTVTGSTITISREYLKQAKAMFESRKRN
ncbi:MAG: DUF2318 domain-containing protein [Spirochaetaceae bacterium]|jgi:uncharacterized membrane protein|nr:DUF2318 domain-containing protein [Spirochaetaceae bacterium]